VSQAENRQPDTAADIAALDNVRTSLQEALGDAQRAYPPRGARRIELMIHAALRETNVQIEKSQSATLGFRWRQFWRYRGPVPTARRTTLSGCR
jgi:hypothetical protein